MKGDMAGDQGIAPAAGFIALSMESFLVEIA